jgi:hypothetical protein
LSVVPDGFLTINRLITHTVPDRILAPMSSPHDMMVVPPVTVVIFWLQAGQLVW